MMTATGFEGIRERDITAMLPKLSRAQQGLAREWLARRALARDLMRTVTGPRYTGTDHMMPIARRYRAA